MEADSPISQRWSLMRERLDERQRRAFAAAEAKVLGRGGVSQV
ncbi:MAG TPA: ISAzo13 family transposase, partial [Burkholderiaceae bacterium]